LIAAVAQLVGGAIMARWAMTYRHEVKPKTFVVEPAGGVLIVTALILIGVSFALLMRSPFRMPLGERLFRLVWLGPIGRAFVRFAGRGKTDGVASTTRSLSPRTPGVPAKSKGAAKPGHVPTTPTGDRVAKLEFRVAELERWREASKG
jgi:hypothetical protein